MSNSKGVHKCKGYLKILRDKKTPESSLIKEIRLQRKITKEVVHRRRLLKKVNRSANYKKLPMF